MAIIRHVRAVGVVESAGKAAHRGATGKETGALEEIGVEATIGGVVETVHDLIARLRSTWKS